MEKEFVPYDLAVKLKKLGFDEPCFAYYNKEVNWNLCWKSSSVEPYNHNDITKYDSLSAPTFSQAFRWFREKGFICHVTNDLSNNLQDEVYVYVMTKGYGSLIDRSEEYSTYEEAELACLIKLIELKPKQQ